MDRIGLGQYCPPGTGDPGAAAGSCRTALEADLVKRVIGLPGQTVSSRGSTVLVEGRPLAGPCLPQGTVLGRPIRPAVRVPPNRYLVLGDNRALSCDSRYWGTIKGYSIIGQVSAVIWRHGHPGLRRI